MCMYLYIKEFHHFIKVVHEELMSIYQCHTEKRKIKKCGKKFHEVLLHTLQMDKKPIYYIIYIKTRI